MMYDYRMTCGLSFSYLYHDVDVMQVRIMVNNNSYQGSADIYIGRRELSEAAAVLEGFPLLPADTRNVIFGAFGQAQAGGALQLEFYCKDLSGHPAIKAKVEEDTLAYGNLSGRRNEPESATIYLDFEPAALDGFLIELRRMERELKGSASLTALSCE